MAITLQATVSTLEDSLTSADTHRTIIVCTHCIIYVYSGGGLLIQCVLRRLCVYVYTSVWSYAHKAHAHTCRHSKCARGEAAWSSRYHVHGFLNKSTPFCLHSHCCKKDLFLNDNKSNEKLLGVACALRKASEAFGIPSAIPCNFGIISARMAQLGRAWNYTVPLSVS